jgi:hypothetical protein
MIVILLLGSTAAHAGPDRGGYVGRALAAVRALGAEGRIKLDRALYEASRQKCRADVETPKPECLIEASRAICAGDASCALVADVIATNLRGTNELLDEATRVRILRKSPDYRSGLTAELANRYAVLAAELVLAGNRKEEGAAIDQLCVQRDREVRACEAGAKACMPSLPWSRCVAALVWYVGGGR